ncbi:MAG: 30S ribosomal protein S20, partial [Phycisphaerales bacterium]|nr:30S ribosomal protein S20 [Phycisphaerales bacterium]
PIAFQRDSGIMLRSRNPREVRQLPNHSHRAKRVRQSLARRARNRWRKRMVKDQTDTFLQALVAGDVATAETAYRTVARTLDKVAATPAMHKNTAARRKSRLNRRLRDLKLGT